MLRYVLRRILWAIPTLFGVSLVVFTITTLLPDPLASISAPVGSDVYEEAMETRRERFLDLPRFINTQPEDVRSRTDACVRQIAAKEPVPTATRPNCLTRLGGAALPHLLPRLSELPPADRQRVAIALAPLAARMQLRNAGQADKPERAIMFWTRFWEDHAIDFTAPATRRAVDRFVQYGGKEREADLRLLDTFVLPDLFVALAETDRRDARSQLSALLSHITGKEISIPDDATDVQMRVQVDRWLSWWFIHELDFRQLDGPGRVIGTVTETRYVRWMGGALRGRLVSGPRSDVPMGDRLRSCAAVTIALTLLAMFLGYAVAIPLGVVAAMFRNRAVDTTIAFVLFSLYSMPVFVLAEALRRIQTGSLFLPVIVLAVASLATLSRAQRAAILDVLEADYVRTARAKGVSGLRLMTLHVLRNASLPVVSLAGVQFPALLGGAYVVEEVFRLKGMGYETLRAIEMHDASWIVVSVLFVAACATLSLLGSDVAQGLLDPRVRETLRRRSA